MSKLFVTPEEVVKLAFSPCDQIEPVVVTDTHIESAQLKFLAPALGKLYDALCKGLYEDFCRQYIKPAAAYFVKYQLFRLLSVRIGNDGIMRMKPADSTPANSSEIGRLRRESRETAGLFLEKALEFLENNPESFPEFDPETRKNKRTRNNGGIVI